MRCWTGCVMMIGWLGCAALVLASNEAASELASGLASQKADLIGESLVGHWKVDVGKRALRMTFGPSNTYRVGRDTGTFSVTDGALRLQWAGTEEPVVYNIVLTGPTFTLSGGDLTQPMQFSRDVSADRPLMSYVRWAFDISPSRLKEHSLRILTVLLIIFISVALIRVLRVVSTFLIYSEWGPLRYIFQRHKSKTRTLHSVALNVIKYVIIFAALGRILAELGVNYTAYIASLSVIGLAIGFGSQGLVQDIVTGLFLILDNQLAVGEMVEISGQTGVVEEVGLRTTRIRNYLGQMVVIPNRNIAQVGNYTRGALKAVVDVAAKDAAAARQAADELKRLGHELARQFAGTVLGTPTAPEVLELATGETFVRMIFDVWPQQQALIDQQVVPRIRELLAAQQVEIPGNLVAVFYRPPEPVEPVRRLDLREGLRKLTRWRED